MEYEIASELEKLSAAWEVDEGLSPALPLETAAALLAGDCLGVTPEEVLPMLRRPGRMRCFEKKACWTGRSGQAAEVLRRQLEREIARACGEFGDRPRVLICLLLSPNVGLEEVEQCAGILSGGGGEALCAFRFQPELPEHTIVVRGLIGAGPQARRRRRRWS